MREREKEREIKRERARTVVFFSIRDKLARISYDRRPCADRVSAKITLGFYSKVRAEDTFFRSTVVFDVES